MFDYEMWKSRPFAMNCQQIQCKQLQFCHSHTFTPSKNNISSTGIFPLLSVQVFRILLVDLKSLNDFTEPKPNGISSVFDEDALR